MSLVLALLVALANSPGCASESAANSGRPDAGSQPENTGKPEAWSGEPAGTASVERVLLLSVDGLHAQDLQRYIRNAPGSTLARLAAVGTRYDQARAPFPSDSFPSVLAWSTGGTPRSTGVYYDIAYDRALSPANSACTARGAHVDFSDAADLDNGRLDGGGGLDPARLPRDPDRGCVAVYPHAFVRVNSLFEVVKQAGKRTAWSDKHLSYEVLQGHSGAGVDDLFDPEVAAVDTKSAAAVQAYDTSKVDAILQQIDGRDHTGQPATVPSLFGMDFQAVSVAQKNYGYSDAEGTPSPALQQALADVDTSLAHIVDALWTHGLWRSSVLVIFASHGQSPIDPHALRRIGVSVIPTLVNEVAPEGLASATQDSVCLLWLKDPQQTDAVAQHLLGHRDAAGIDRLILGSELRALFGDPGKDSRVPDIVAIAKTGTVYTDSTKKLAEHGGDSDDDRHVALLWVGGQRTGQVVTDTVETRQLAPSVLQALQLDPMQLEALTKEPADALPGLTPTL